MPSEGVDADLRERSQKHISFGEVTEKNVDQVRKLNLAVFPVRYVDANSGLAVFQFQGLTVAVKRVA